MRLSTTLLVVASIGITAPAGRAAQAEKVAGTIRSLDAKARLISVAPPGGKPRPLELEVSRKARITVEGGEAALDDLRVGQEAVVTYDSGLGVATEIRASGAGEAPPEVAELAEVNTRRRDFCPWPSPDGLTLYWVSDTPGDPEGEVWEARRRDAGALFTGKRVVGYGRNIAVSGDGLTLLLTARRTDGGPGESIRAATRPSADEAFGRPREVAELRSVESPRNLSLSADGLTLLFVTGAGDGDDARVWEAARRTPQSAWSRPRPLAVPAGRGVEGHVISPQLSGDGTTLLGVVTGGGRGGEPAIMKWVRTGPGGPFTGPRPVAVPGMEALSGWQPRYVEATHELFYCTNRVRPDSGLDIMVVRNLTP